MLKNLEEEMLFLTEGKLCLLRQFCKYKLDLEKIYNEQVDMFNKL